MNIQEAKAMKKHIRQDYPELECTGSLAYGPDSYALTLVDKKTGTPFTIHTLEQWQEKVKEWNFWSTHTVEDASND